MNSQLKNIFDIYKRNYTTLPKSKNIQKDSIVFIYY